MIHVNSTNQSTKNHQSNENNERDAVYVYCAKGVAKEEGFGVNPSPHWELKMHFSQSEGKILKKFAYDAFFLIFLLYVIF